MHVAGLVSNRSWILSALLTTTNSDDLDREYPVKIGVSVLSRSDCGSHSAVNFVLGSSDSRGTLR